MQTLAGRWAGRAAQSCQSADMRPSSQTAVHSQPAASARYQAAGYQAQVTPGQAIDAPERRRGGRSREEAAGLGGQHVFRRRHTDICRTRAALSEPEYG